jgi:hypothetical protein
MDNAVDDGTITPTQVHDQPPVRQLVGTQVDSLSARQFFGRGVAPAKRLQVGITDLARDAVVGMIDAEAARAPRPLAPIAMAMVRATQSRVSSLLWPPTMPDRRDLGLGQLGVVGEILDTE